MSKPTTPKPPPTPAKSEVRRARKKFRPSQRFRSWGCAPLATDKLIERETFFARYARGDTGVIAHLAMLRAKRTKQGIAPTAWPEPEGYLDIVE